MSRASAAVMRKASKKWADANPERIRALNKSKWQRRQERLLADPAAYAAYRTRIRGLSLAEYGLTVAQYDEMLLRQGGVCAICHDRNADGRRLAVDHCHSTGRVRGLLCHACNTSLGLMRDAPERMRAAADHLERAR